MGVSGSGKTTVASSFATLTGWVFLEGDTFHPLSNIEKMSRGVPLDDADRGPWLAALGQEMSDLSRSGNAVVAACSALRESYRDTLRGFAPGIRFVHLDCPTELLSVRLAERKGHFADSRLLESQLDTLEPPEGADTLVVDARLPVAQIIHEIQACLLRRYSL